MCILNICRFLFIIAGARVKWIVPVVYINLFFAPPTGIRADKPAYDLFNLFNKYIFQFIYKKPIFFLHKLKKN